MIFKLIKPTTPSQRQLIKLNQNNLSKKPVIKSSIVGLKRSGGRNNSGKITVFHRGGGHKRKYRKIDFKRTVESEGVICTLEYDPNRNANIASVYDFLNNYFYYIIAPLELSLGDIVKSGAKAEVKTGHSLPLSKIPVGTYIHNISLKEKGKAVLARSAGAYARIVEKTLDSVKIELKSGKLYTVSSKCNAVIGIVSNDSYFLTQLGKAGRSRWLGNRPVVRGVAMNPVDHPNGGGEGKQSGKSKTPWGKPVKSGKTGKTKK